MVMLAKERREPQQGWSLESVKRGLEIVMMIDESHHHTNIMTVHSSGIKLGPTLLILHKHNFFLFA